MLLVLCSKSWIYLLHGVIFSSNMLFLTHPYASDIIDGFMVFMGWETQFILFVAERGFLNAILQRSLFTYLHDIVFIVHGVYNVIHTIEFLYMFK